MKINTNTWNRIRYTLYTPGYDLVARLMDVSRKKSIDSMEIKPGDRVLIVGAGTGLDLEFLPPGCEITATDITPAMVDKIKQRNERRQLDVKSLVMDGQSLKFADASFDHVILHLILAVIPDPDRCMQESVRVLKPGGTMVVYDKFVGPGQHVSFLRRGLNIFTNLFFSDITRSFESISQNKGMTVVSDQKADLNGLFRLIKLVKTGD